MPSHDGGKTKEQQDEEQGDLMETYLEREKGNSKMSVEDMESRSEEINGQTTIGSGQFEKMGGEIPSTRDIVNKRVEEMMANGSTGEKVYSTEDAASYNPSNKYFEELEEMERKEKEKLSPEEIEKRRKELDDAVLAARMNFAKKNYEATNILSRLKNKLTLRTRPGNLQENHDLYNQYQICLNDRLQFDIEELKSKNLPPDEFQKEAEKLAKYYNQDEKSNLYGTHTDARAKIWEEKLGKAPGWIAEKSGKFVNWYRKANWKGKLAFSIGAGLSGAGLLMIGQRVLGGAAAGVGIHGALESRYRKKEETRLQGEREEMMKNVEGIEGQEQKCEALMQMLQNEVGGFQKDLQRERKGAFRRKLLGGSVAAFIGSGKLAEFVKWGMTETNAAEHVKSAWVGLVGQKFADQVSDKFGEIGKVLKGTYDSIRNSAFVQKIPGMAKGAADGFGKHFAAGVGMEEAAGHPNVTSEFKEGVVPSQGEGIFSPESKSGSDMTQFEQDVRRSDLAKGNRPSGMTQFEQDVRDSDLGKGKIISPSEPNLGETYTENSLKMDKGVKYSGVASEYGEGVVPSQGEDVISPESKPGGKMDQVGGNNENYEQLKKAYDQKPEVDLSQKAPDLQNADLGGSEVEGQNVKPVGEVSNQGMEKTYGHIKPVGEVSNEGFTNKILEIKKGSSIEHTMIKSGMDPGEAHRMVLAYAKEQGIPANKLDLAHPGAKLVLSPDGKHIVNFEDSQHSFPKSQVHEQKAARHSARPRVERVDSVPEKPKIEHIPEVKEIQLSEVSNQLEGIKEIEIENNALAANKAELQQKIMRLSEQIKYDKQSLALGKDYPGQIRSGPSLKESMSFREESLKQLEKQMEINDAKIEALQRSYKGKFGSAFKMIVDNQGEDISKEKALEYMKTHKDSRFNRFYDDCRVTYRGTGFRVRPTREQTIGEWAIKVITRAARDRVRY